MSKMQSVEVFAAGPSGGQPVGICVHDGELDDADMQRLASQSSITAAPITETAFVRRGDNAVQVFRQDQELPFSATGALAAAWALRQDDGSDSKAAIRLGLSLGDVEVRAEAGGQDGETLWWLSAPTITLAAPWPTAELYGLLGLRTAPPDDLPAAQLTSMTVPILLVPVPGLAELSACRLDGAAFKGYAVQRVRHLALHMKVYLVCAQARAADNDLAARLLRPGKEQITDAASGDAAACLGAWLMQHNVLASKMTDHHGVGLEQGYESGRPSRIQLRSQTPAQGPGIEVGGVITTVLNR